MRIKCHSLHDFARNQGACFSKKVFCALNAQAIANDKKWISWASVALVGSAHDSDCFKSTKLLQTLCELENYLPEKIFYFLEDSAHPLHSFLLIPHENAQPDSKEDVFNFYYSRNRILSECSFGEIDM